MLLCGIIDELRSTEDPVLVSFFFCQRTDSRLNSATAVLRGLLYLLVDALDECCDGQLMLIDLINHLSTASPQVKLAYLMPPPTRHV
ncbi:hypothetical protein V8C42DRAFT_327284 [Trichoderma barbatum]